MLTISVIGQEQVGKVMFSSVSLCAHINNSARRSYHSFCLRGCLDRFVNGCWVLRWGAYFVPAGYNVPCLQLCNMVISWAGDVQSGNLYYVCVHWISFMHSLGCTSFLSSFQCSLFDIGGYAKPDFVFWFSSYYELVLGH